MQTLRAELAPHGCLRVGLNMSNFLLVQAGVDGGAPTGIVPDLASQIAAHIGVPITWLPYADAGLVADGAQADIAQDAWDVAFMGAEPARAARIDFTPAYVEIEASCLVPAGSAIDGLDALDRPGVRIATAARAAYTLYLQRTLQHAELVTAEGLEGSFQLFQQGGFDALAGLKPRLLNDRPRLPGTQLLPGRFTAIQQSIATPRGRPAAFAFLRDFAQTIKTDGTAAGLIARHGVQGLTVAAP
jgi:polar amino acid transport system substrate-binding protein